MSKLSLIAIVGPTASGKSKLAVNLARKLGGEIISADSRQIYKGLDIGSGRVTKKEMRGVEHYGLGIASLRKRFTAHDFRKYAEEKITEIRKKGKLPIIVGGTGFYVDAILYDNVLPATPPNLLLRRRLGDRTTNQLFAALKKLDPERAKTIDQKNPRRLIRALEIAKALGKVPKLKKKSCYDAKIILLDPKKKKLQKNISRRARAMLKRGLVAEVKKLVRQKIPRARIFELGFEYKYPFLYLEGRLSKEDMIKKINTKTWQYARHQMTYFRKMLQITK